MIKTERDLVDLIEASFLDRDFITAREIKMLSKFIDIIAYNPVDDEVIAVEAKLSKWRRAFQQAMTYRICADRVYIAISNDFSHRIDSVLLRKYGLGLIICDENRVYTKLKAGRVTSPHVRLREEIINSLRLNNGIF
jgi:hypothetical protein